MVFEMIEQLIFRDHKNEKLFKNKCERFKTKLL